MNCTLRSPGHLRRYALYKGLRPLRCFTAIPAPSPGMYTRDPTVPFQRVINRMLSSLTVYQTQQVNGLFLPRKLTMMEELEAHIA